MGDSHNLWTNQSSKFKLTHVDLLQVVAFVMDNTSNNDTMVEAIECKCTVASIAFSARESRLCCMPHTVHLAALKVFYI